MRTALDGVPLLDLGFKAYGKAFEAMDLASRALGDVLHTVGLALTRVANHYEHASALTDRMHDLSGTRPGDPVDIDAHLAELRRLTEG